MQLTIYTIVNPSANELEMFLTSEAEEARATALMRELGNSSVKKLLKADKDGGAWAEFAAQMWERGERWERHENDIDLPEVGEGVLLTALKAVLKIATGGVVMRHETGKPTWDAMAETAKIARAAIATVKEA